MISSNRFFQSPPSKSGRLLGLFAFTLIEILVVIILLGVVAGLAVPNFNSTYEKFLLGETAKDLSFFMRYAQNRAVMKSQNHRLVFDLQDSKYWLEEQENDTDNLSQEEVFAGISGRFGRIFKIPEGIFLETEKTHIFFYPDGKIDKARIYLSDKKKNYLTISTYEQDGYVQTFDFKME